MDQAKIGIFVEERSYDTLFTLVTLDDNDTLRDALRRFAGHKILSAPVRCHHRGGTASHGGQESQIMSYGQESTSFAPSNYKMIDLLDIAVALFEYKDDPNVFDMPIYKFCNTSKLNPFLTIMSDASVQEAVSILSIGVHRIVVLDQATDKPMGVVSQMDILRWITKHFDWVPFQLRHTPASSTTKSTQVISANLNEPVIDALRKIVLNRYSGVAVLDDNGSLIANFSISDLRILSEQNIHLLWNSLERFLEEIKKFPMHKPPVTCNPDTHLEDVIKTLVNEHIHRMYIANDKNQPLGVVSISDIINCLPK